MEFDVGTPSGTYDAYIQIEVKVVDAVPVPKSLNTGRYVKIDTRDNIGGANGFELLVLWMLRKLKRYMFLQPS